MPIPPKMGQTETPRPAWDLFIVARGHVALYHALDRAFGGPGGILVLFDRRRAERRRTVHAASEERRRAERRSFPCLGDPRRWSCVLVRPPD